MDMPAHDMNGYEVKGRSLVRDEESTALVYCQYGIRGKCWWCDTINKQTPTDDAQRILAKRIDALRNIIFYLIMPMLKQGAASQPWIVSSPTQQNQLIGTGPDSNRPATNGPGYVFYYSTDKDVISQWRDSSWIDISFSRPTAGETRVTDVSIETDGNPELTTL